MKAFDLEFRDLSPKYPFGFRLNRPVRTTKSTVVKARVACVRLGTCVGAKPGLQAASETGAIILQTHGVGLCM